MKKNKTLTKLARKMADLSFENGKLNQAKVKIFVEDIKDRHLIKSLLLLKEYLKALKQLSEKYTALVESATKLSSAEISKIKSALRQDFKISELELKINPNLLGGLKIKIGDTLFDNSVVNKIYQLGEAIKESRN